MTRMALKKPLEGLKVVDLTIWLYGPLAGTLLADLGATVVKIERPEQGDFSRSLATLQGASMHTSDQRNLAWELFNRNKQSLTLNLRAPGGQEVFRRLVRDADAFVTNFQPSTLAAFHALPSELLELNPHLVYGLGAGLGTRGRFADVPSQDTAAMAYSGYMFTSSPSPDEPYYPPGGMADVLSGTNLAFGVTSALLGRERDAERRGRVVSTSLLQSMMWTQMLNVGVAANNGQSLKSAPRARAANPLMNAYRCKDGAWIALGVPYLHDAAWSALTRALGGAAPLADARFASEASRWAEVPSIIAALDAVFAEDTCSAWVERCRAAEVWCSPVNRPERLAEDPGVVEEGLMGETASGIRHVRGPFTLEGTEASTAPAPALGASSEAVLADLGFDRAEIARLRAAKAI